MKQKTYLLPGTSDYFLLRCFLVSGNVDALPQLCLPRADGQLYSNVGALVRLPFGLYAKGGRCICTVIRAYKGHILWRS